MTNEYSMSIHFHSANELLGSNYVWMKVISIKMCRNEDMSERTINYYPKLILEDGCGCIGVENTPLFHLFPKNPSDFRSDWLLVMGFQAFSGVSGRDTAIDFSQDHNKLIHPATANQIRRRSMQNPDFPPCTDATRRISS